MRIVNRPLTTSKIPKGTTFFCPACRDPRLGRLLAARLATAGEIPQVHLGFGIYGDPQSLFALVGCLVGLTHVFKNRVGLLDALDRFSFLHPAQTVAQTVEDVADRVLTRQILGAPPFLLDQRLPHRFRGNPRVEKGGLELGIYLAFRFR